MKRLAILVTAFCVSCSTEKPHTAEKPDTAQREPDASRFVALPPLQIPVEYVWGTRDWAGWGKGDLNDRIPGWVKVDLKDRVQRNEAAAIAQAYADLFLHHTGIFQEPVDYGEFWQVYYPTDQWDGNHVYFRIWKDGRAYIVPSEKGFTRNTKLYLERQANQIKQNPASPK